MSRVVSQNIEEECRLNPQQELGRCIYCEERCDEAANYHGYCHEQHQDEIKSTQRSTLIWHQHKVE